MGQREYEILYDEYLQSIEDMWYDFIYDELWEQGAEKSALNSLILKLNNTSNLILQ